MSHGGPDPAERAELYRRLPLLESDRWWLDLGRASPDGRVLELGAGTGRLTAAFARAGLEVTAVERDPAMLEVLHERVGRTATIVARDVVELPALRPVGLVVLPSSLLNELPDHAARRAVLAGAARSCRPDGRVALHVLGPWWLSTMAGRATGRLRPADGSPTIDVTVTAGALEPWDGRRRAVLSYHFADGSVLSDHLDAAVVTGAEIDDAAASAGLVVEERFGASPPEGAADTGPAWHVLCRPRT